MFAGVVAEEAVGAGATVSLAVEPAGSTGFTSAGGALTGEATVVGGGVIAVSLLAIVATVED